MSSDLEEKKGNGDTVERHKNIKKVFITLFFIILFLAVLQILFDVQITTLIKDLFMLKYLPKLGNNASFGLLFIFGLLTSFHCVGMCGGIAISQTVKQSQKGASVFIPSALYNLGRIISYTLVGAIVGGLGQIISFSGMWRGVIPIIGGVFMVIMGVNLLEIFPAFRYINIRMPLFFAKKIHSKNNYGPFVIGILTGLMPCGPLQMMQLYALGTKSIFYGAASLFVFAFGTVPMMFLFGALNTFLNKKYSKVILHISAILVLILGITMIGRGLALTGVADSSIYVFNNEERSAEIKAVVENGVQKVTGAIGQDSFPAIVVQKGLPVEFTLMAEEKDLNDCNKSLTIPKFEMDKDLVPGENIIRFTPEETGIISYTCWMGMIKSTITVVDSLETSSLEAAAINTAALEQEVQQHEQTKKPCVDMKKSCKMPKEQKTQTSEDTKAAAAKQELPKNQKTEVTSKSPVKAAEKQSSPSKASKSHTAKPPGESPDNMIQQKDNAASVNGWVEEKLMPNSNETNGKKVIQTWTGWVFDRDCIGVNPVKHTKACNQMESCIKSGLGIIQYVPGKAFDTYTALEYHLNFDGASKELVGEFLKALPEGWKNNVTIKVKGYAVSNIPAAKDEPYIPEPDASKVDHYLKGIHITSIEAAYIEGLSTNPLPKPNIILTQP